MRYSVLPHSSDPYLETGMQRLFVPPAVGQLGGEGSASSSSGTVGAWFTSLIGADTHDDDSVSGRQAGKIQ